MIQSIIDSVSHARLDQEGGDLVLRYGYGSIILWVLGLLVLLLVAVLLWRKWKRKDYAAGALALAVIMGVIAVPGVFTTRITIGPDYISQTTGFWFDQSVVRLPFSGTTRIVVSMRQQEGRVERNVMVWTFQEPDREATPFEPSELWTANAVLIADELRKRGANIEGLVK